MSSPSPLPECPEDRLRSRPGRRFRGWPAWILLAAALGCALLFGARAYPFLAVPTHRVPAEVLVVEGWIFDYGLDAAAVEFRQGHYAFVAISGVRFAADEISDPDDSYARRAAEALTARGIPSASIVVCPAPATGWNRTSSSARAVRDHLAARHIACTGMNVLTIGPHARQTWLAYRRIMGPNLRVGIITVPKQGVDTDRWWASAHGIAMVLKDFAGWLKEWLFGYRH